MRLERQQHLGVGPYERSEARQGYSNGFKPKTVQTRVGTLEFTVPQVRDSGFYPSSLEKGLRSEQALKLALAEMYVRGVSTRKVAKITEQPCGFEVTSTQVSRAAKELDEVLEQWRSRPLGAYPYVYLDARYEKVRNDGSVIDMAVLVALASTSVDLNALLSIISRIFEILHQSIEQVFGSGHPCL
jgi:transposase-like protein